MNEVAIKSRFPMPEGLTDIDAGKWRLLCESVFPSAKTPEAIMLALDYCRARKLDVMKKPVHIVPMWSSDLKKYVETVWPSITEVMTTAARTGQFAGMDEPSWGPLKTRAFVGKLKDNVGDTTMSITYPEWCAVTVYRIIGGQRCAFTEPVYWLETYGRIGKTELPNDQWAKRPMGMLIKVAKAFSIRAAFPEESSYTAEEMQGRPLEITETSMVIDGSDTLGGKSPFKKNSHRNTFCESVEKSFEDAKTTDDLNLILDMNKAQFDLMEQSENVHDDLGLEKMRQKFKLCWNRLVNEAKKDEDLDPDGEFDMPKDL